MVGHTAAEDKVGYIGAEAELVAQLDAMLGAKLGDVLLPVVDDLRPDVRELTPGKSFPQREHPAADAVARLHHDHIVARCLDPGRGNKTRQARSDHYDLHCTIT